MRLLLYLMRHSIPEPSAASDRDRCLTVPGRERALLIGQGLAAMGVRFDRVLTSPYPRAAETAAIVAEAVGAVAPTEARALVHGELDPMCKALGRDASGSILLVGHEPSCGAFAASLLCPGSRDGVRLRFEQGQVACIEVSSLPPRWPGRLVLHAPPSLFGA